jgi:maleate cis-trans isomerase
MEALDHVDADAVVFSSCVQMLSLSSIQATEYRDWYGKKCVREREQGR